ncbi:MAG: STAS domain-containing protein [Treponema sp.]|nr:STAS domain-containing protein [Treponema sp.]MCL2272325.1 STAS domain-containing protein [Treponema sp.]
MKSDVLEITEDKSEGKYRLHAKGRVDSNSADLLLYKLENVIKENHNNIILDMSQIEYLSSIGIRVILKIFKQVTQEGGSFNIEHPSNIVRNVLGMVALKEMLVPE